MSRWNPASLYINREVVAKLKLGQVFYGFRRVGKTETLMAYIAMHHDYAIVVAETVPNLSYIRHVWKTRYPLLPEPKFMSIRQFEQADGMTGTAFSDECYDLQASRRFYSPYLKFGGGVQSL